jgi:hypothetical protein
VGRRKAVGVHFAFNWVACSHKECGVLILWDLGVHRVLEEGVANGTPLPRDVGLRVLRVILGWHFERV